MTVRAIFSAIFLASVLGAAAAAMAAAPASAPARANAAAVDFGASDAVLDVGAQLAPSKVATPSDPEEKWFTVPVKNEGVQPVVRVLITSELPSADLAVMPEHARPILREAAASDSGVVIEKTNAYGRGAFRVILPAAHAATLALRFVGTHEPPSVFAWTEPALIAHNRRAGVLFGVVMGLLAAATAITIGAATLTGRRFAIWGSFFLGALLFANFAATGLFDNGWLADPGGPYGLFAFALSLVLGAAIKLVDFVAPFEAEYSGAGPWRDRVGLGIVLLGVAAFVGVPGSGLLVRVLAVLGAAGAAGYLAHCGRLGIASARKLAPAAAIFALVTAAAAFQAAGLFQGNLVAPAAIGGFSAAGALLLALACAADNFGQGVAPRAGAQSLGVSRDLKPDASRHRTRDISAVAAAHQGVFDLDLKTGALSMSPETATIFGLAKSVTELSSEAWLKRIHQQDRAVYEQALAAYRADPGVAFRLEFRARGESNKMHWFELRATVTGIGGKAERCLGLIANVNARKLSEAELARAALNDPLTGLGNRIALLARLEEVGGVLARTVLAVFDIDRFKSVDASVGAEGADGLLRAVAERLTQRFPGNALFRVGGDMFAMLAANAKPAELGEALIEMMRAPFTAVGRDIFLPASVGVAAGTEAGNPFELLSQAELAMTQAKRDGGGRVCVYSRPVNETAVAKPVMGDPVALETELRNAIKKGQIEVHYQPIMRMKNNGIAGFEALLRWRHPEHGLIAPYEFVAHSERTGLILPLGRLVLRRAAKDLARWQRFFPLKPPLFVSVNVSWQQLRDGDFAKELESVLEKGDLAKRTLKLEITESAVMKDADAAEDALKHLRKLGAGLAIDDFGTGHSSLSQLKRFPFDVIKIDRSFLAEARKNGGGTILASMVSLAHELGLEVVAEGVENQDDADRLRALGCEYAQGYLYGAPLPGSEVNPFIAMTYKTFK